MQIDGHPVLERFLRCEYPSYRAPFPELDSGI